MTPESPKSNLSKKACQTDALRYRSRCRWERYSPDIFKFAKSKGWLKDCCAHMKKLRAVWDLERCKSDALRFEHIVDWRLGSNTCNGYYIAKKNGWIDECCEHMTPKPKELKWTLVTCKQDALNYNHKKSWCDATDSGYGAARRNGWLDECCAHMGKYLKWSLEACKADALKFKSRTEWSQAPKSGYVCAARKGWLDECCAHMKKKDGSKKRNPRWWDLDACQKDALRYQTCGEWGTKSPSAYNSARTNQWLDLCCAHMKDNRKKARVYTLDHCMTDARLYDHSTDWRKASYPVYKFAWLSGWLDECCAHMTRKKLSSQSIVN